jgi:hypothetical protein
MLKKHIIAALFLILSGFASAFAQTAEIPQLAQPKLIALPRSLKQ